MLQWNYAGGDGDDDKDDDGNFDDVGGGVGGDSHWEYINQLSNVAWNSGWNGNEVSLHEENSLVATIELFDNTICMIDTTNMSMRGINNRSLT